MMLGGMDGIWNSAQVTEVLSCLCLSLLTRIEFLPSSILVISVAQTAGII